MPAWDDYTLKEKPGDEDTLMIKDNAATTKANKRTKFSGLWNWIVDKLAAAVIANLNTTNKTVIGALNELNSKTPHGSVINNTQLLSAPGWYKLASRSIPIESVVYCSLGDLLNVFIATDYNNNVSMAIQLCIALGYNDFVPQIINKTKNISCVTKIREVYYKPEGKAYLEFYYASSKENSIFTKITSIHRLYDDEKLIIDNGTPTETIYEIDFGNL